MPIFRTYPFLPTAFHDDGTFDADGQAAVAATTAAAGVDGLAILGLTTGEVGQLRIEEVGEVVVAARRGASGLPLAVGLGPPGSGTLAVARRAGGAGADVLVASVPATGNRQEQLGIVADLGLPLWLHHHPGMTGATLTGDELTALADDVGARAVIVESAPPGELLGDLAAVADRERFGGLAALFLPEEAEAGATGTVAGCAVPERLVEVAARLRAGDAASAWDAYLELLPWLRLEAGSPGRRVRKEAWRQRGVLGSARVRDGAPLGTTTKIAITRRLRQVGADVSAPYPGS